MILLRSGQIQDGPRRRHAKYRSCHHVKGTYRKPLGRLVCFPLLSRAANSTTFLSSISCLLHLLLVVYSALGRILVHDVVLQLNRVRCNHQIASSLFETHSFHSRNSCNLSCNSTPNITMFSRSMQRSGPRGPKRSPTPTSATFPNSGGNGDVNQPPSPSTTSSNPQKPLYLCSPFVEAALVKGNFKTIVMLPKYVDVTEWVAVNSEFLSFIPQGCLCALDGCKYSHHAHPRRISSL